MKVNMYILTILVVLLNVLLTGCNGGHGPAKPDDCFRCTFTPTPDMNLTATFTATHTNTYTNTPTNTPVIKNEELLDNMDDGDNINNWGGYWYSFDDSGSGGDSYVVPIPDTPFFMQRPGITDSGYAARITGYVTTTFFYGFIGMGTMLNNTHMPLDINKYSKIKFWCKGDGGEYKIMFVSAYPDFILYSGDNHYSYKFVAPLNWTQYEINLTQFTQELYWGSVVDRINALSQVTDIYFQTFSNIPKSVDLWIDEIVFEK